MTSNKVEAAISSYLFSKATKMKIPLSGTFELTPMCNFNCRMCYVRKSAQEVKNHPRLGLHAGQWIEIARQAKEEGMLYLLLTGGEPLLWPEFWELYEALSKMGLLISINTNGSMIDEEAVKRFVQMPPTRINITLYGTSDKAYKELCQVDGMFTKVDKAISLLVDAGISVKLNGSLTPWNVKDLESCVIYAKSRNLIYEPNSYMFPPMRRDENLIGCNERFNPKEAAYYRMHSYHLQFGDEAYRKYLESIQQGYVWPLGLDESCVDPLDGTVRCRAGKAAFWVTWDGWITPCGMMDKPMIDMNGKSFETSWRLVKEATEQIILSGVCTKCPNRGLCHSCAAMALTETGTLSGIPTYLCEMVKEMKNQADIELSRLNKNKEV